MSNCQPYTFTAYYRWWSIKRGREFKSWGLCIWTSVSCFSTCTMQVSRLPERSHDERSFHLWSVTRTQGNMCFLLWDLHLSAWSCALCELGRLHGHLFCYCWQCFPQTLSSLCFASFPYFKSMLPGVSNLLTLWHSVVGSKVRIQELYHLVFFLSLRNVLSKCGCVLGPCHSCFGLMQLADCSSVTRQACCTSASWGPTNELTGIWHMYD